MHAVCISPVQFCNQTLLWVRIIGVSFRVPRNIDMDDAVVGQQTGFE